MISIVVPAHNEEEVIEKTLRGLVNGVTSQHEIIVVADHCSDRTESIVLAFAASHTSVKFITNTRAGCFGNALRAGFEAAKGDAVVPVMADMCDDPQTIDKLYKKLEEGYDMVAGSRYMKGGRKSGGPIIQGIASRIVSFSLKLLSGIPTWDVANSLKMYRKQFLESVGYDIEGAGTEFSMRLAFKAYFAHGRITEIPTSWHGEHIPLSDEFKIFKRTPGYLAAYVAALYKKFFTQPTSLAAVIFLATISLLLFFPLLFQGMIFSEGERISGYYPWAVFYSEAIHTGQSILWNPYYFGGYPTFLNQFIGNLYPLHYLLFYFLPAITAFHVAIVSALFGGMFFAYAFGRANSFSIIGSLILALTYTIGQTFGLFSTGISYAVSFFVLPFLLFSILKAKRSLGFWSFSFWSFLGGVAIGIGFLAGFSQTFLYSLIFVGCYSLFLDISELSRFRISSFKAILATFVSGMFGVLMGSPQLLSVLAFIPYSVRTLDYTSNEGFLRVYDLITFVVPYYIHVPHFMAGASGVYFGGCAFALFLYSLIFVRGKRVWFFALSYFVVLAFSYHVPLISLINDHGPFLSRLGSVTRWLFVGAFPFAVVVALGFEHLLQHREILIRSKLFSRFTAFTALLLWGTASVLLFFSVALLYLSHHAALQTSLLGIFLKGKTLSFPLSHYQDVFTENMRELYHPISLTSPTFLLFLTCTILTPALFIYFKKAKSVAVFRALALMLIGVNLLVSFTAENEGAFISKDYFLETPPVAEAILAREKDTHSFRILPFLMPEGFFRDIYGKREISQAESAIINRNFLMSDIGTYYGIENIAGFEPLRDIRQNQLIDTLIDPNASYVFDTKAVAGGARIDQHVNSEALRQVSIDEKIASFLKQQSLISMFNVKYVVSYYPLSAPNLLPIQIATSTLAPTYLYENKTVLPRIYFAKKPIMYDGTDRDLLIQLTLPHDFSKETFIECKSCDAEPSGLTHVELSEYRGGYVRAAAVTQSGGWLVLSDAYLPGWKATIDGKATSIYHANYLFQAVYVPPGQHSIEFYYENGLHDIITNLKSLYKSTML